MLPHCSPSASDARNDDPCALARACRAGVGPRVACRWARRARPGPTSHNQSRSGFAACGPGWHGCGEPTRTPGDPPHHGRRTVRAAPRDPRPARRAGPRPDDERPRRPDLPDDVVRLRRHRARRGPLRAGGARQHLHADHEPDAGRARAAPRRARGRHRVGRDRVGAGRRHLLRPERRRARATTSCRSRRSTAGPTTSSRTRCRSTASRCAVADPDDPAQLASARRRQDRLVFGETIGNPRADVLDFARLGRRRARSRACRSSSTTRSRRRSCAAPSTTAPTSSVHSATKFIGGHGTSIGGVDRRRRHVRLDRARRPLPRA